MLKITLTHKVNILNLTAKSREYNAYKMSDYCSLSINLQKFDVSRQSDDQKYFNLKENSLADTLQGMLLIQSFLSK